jgi:PEGA domain-containing protein
MKALEKRVDMRYPTMDELIRAMADPVGYVEAHGGIQPFMAQQLMPSTAPLPMKLTPAPITPVPGMLSGMGSAPSLAGIASAPAPTGFGPQPKKSVAGFVIAGTLVVAAAVVGVIVVLSGNKPKKAEPDLGSQAMVVTPVATPDAKIEDRTVEKAVVTPALDAGPPPPSKIALKSNPAGAEIFEAGKDTGQKTPATIEIARGIHKVQFELRLKGYQPRILDDLDADGGDQTLALDLREDVKKKPVVPVRPPPPRRGSNGTGQGSNDTRLLKPGED